MSKKFDASSIFSVLPSFWREYYKDKPTITALYDAFLRLQESDYSRLFHIDDAKSIASVPITTAYPVVYEELTSWDSVFPGHAHFLTEQVFSPVKQRYLGDNNPEYYKVVIAGHLFKKGVQLYLNGRFVPSFLYIRSAEPVISGSHLLRGTTFYIDADKLATFIQTQPSLLQHWPEIEELNTVAVYSVDDVVPFYIDLTGTETEVMFPDLGGRTVVPEQSAIVLESVEVTSRVRVTSYGTYSAIVPTSGRKFVPGQVFRVLLENNTVQDITALSEDQVIAATSLAVTEVHEVFNFTISPINLSITQTAISLTTGRFPVGSSIRVTDNKGSFSVTVKAPVTRVSLPRNIDTATAVVSILNIDLNRLRILEDRVVLGNRAVSGTRLRVEASTASDHTHHTFTTTLAENIASVTLPHTPLSGHPIRVFTDGLLLDAGSFTVAGNQVSFDELPEGTQLTVFFSYLPTTVTAHSHHQQEFVVPIGAQAASSVLLDNVLSGSSEIFTLSGDPEIFIDSGTYNNSEITVVANQNLVFSQPLTPGSFVTVFVEQTGRPFRHILPERADSAYDYRGKIVDVEVIQDGITEAQTRLVKGTSFDIVDENGVSYLYADATIDKAWLFNVSVDERSLSKVWGTLFDIDEASSNASYRRIASLVAASRATPLLDNIVNLGSIILGSAYLEEPGTSLGIVKNSDGSAVSIRPSDEAAESFLVPLIPGADVRVRDGEQLPRLHAVNALVKVSDRDLSTNKWLPVFAEALSTDFRLADRLDAGKPFKVISRPTSFDPATHILTDYSVNFVDAEVRQKDMIKVEFTPTDIANQATSLETKLIKVTKVLGPHQLLLEELVVNPSLSGWGDLAFGAGTYGGGIFRPKIWKYTIWSRATRRLDSFTGLDTIPSEGKALIPAEDLGWVASRLSDILKHHLFTVKLDWNQVKDVATLNDLKRLLQLIKPSETAAVVYAEYNNDTGIKEALAGTVSDSSPSLSVAGAPVADSFVVGESHVSGAYVPNNLAIGQLYAPQSFAYGPDVYALTYGPDTQPEAGRLYLTTTQSSMAAAGSLWANTYSQNHGLANVVLRSSYTSPFYTYTLYNTFGNRSVGRAITLTGARALKGTLASSPALTFRTWLKIPATHTLSPGVSPSVLYTTNGPEFLLRVLSPNGFRFGARRSPSASPHFTTTSFVKNTPVFLAASIAASGSGHLYVNNASTAIAIGPTASFSGTAFIGSSSDSLLSGKSLQADLDETVVVSYAASPLVVSRWYNSGNGMWSSPFGVGQGPLAETKAELVLHYDLEQVNNILIFDHSGKGRDLTKISSVAGDTNTDWTTPGMVSTPLPSEGDFYAVSRDGYHVSDGILVSAGSQYSLRDAESELVPSSFYTVNRGDRVFYDPNIAYAYASGGWVRRAYFANSLGASVGTSSQDEFTGFVSGGYVDPEGNTVSTIMPTNVTIGDDPAVVLSAKNNGAISSITSSAYEYLYVGAKKDLFQNKWDAGGLYTLCETGFDYLSPEASPKSRLISFSSNSQEAASSVYAAYAYPRTVGVAVLEAAGDKILKRVKTSALNNPHIIELDSAFDFYVSKVLQNASWVHSFAASSPFTVAHTFLVGTGTPETLTPVTLSAPEDGTRHHLNTSFKGGVILSTQDMSRAIGIYHNGPSKPSHAITTDIVYETSPETHVTFISREHNQERGGYAQGVHVKSRYLCVGSFADVTASFVQLYRTLNNLSELPPSSAVTLDAQPWAVQGQGLNSPFSITVSALNNLGALDTLWGLPVVATLTQGTGLQGTLTQSPVSGVAVFSDLSFNTYGNKTITFSSGTLSDTVTVVVPYPAPTITALSPSSAVINYGTQNVAITGTGFLPDSGVTITSVPVAASSITYVSPTRLVLALPLVPPAGLRRISVTNPAPGGGISNIGGFSVLTPPPTVLSPHYLQLGAFPLSWNEGRAEFVPVTAYQSPTNAISVVADGVFKVSVYSATNQLVSTFSQSPVAGTAVIQPVIATAGSYRLQATHSPVTLGPARASSLSQYITVYSEDPLVSRVSPAWFAPSVIAAPLIDVFGDNFTASSQILFNGLTRSTSFVSPKHAQAILNVGDIATQGTYPVQVFVPTAVNQISNAVTISVSPTFVPPAVVSPSALTLTVGAGPFNAGSSIAFTSTVLGSSGSLATYAAGRFTLVASPINDTQYPDFVGTLSYTAPSVYTNSQLAGTLSINSFGQYRVTAQYSPAIGEPTVTSASRSFITLVGPPSVLRVSPSSYSPAGTQTVSFIGSGFTNTARALYYTIPNASDVVTRPTTFVNSARVTFTLSPSDYPAAGTRQVYTVINQPFSTANSGVQFLSLVKPPSTSPYYLSFKADPTNPNAPFQVPTTIRVGGGWISGPQQVIINAFTKEDVVASAATGGVVLTTSPVSAESTGSLTLRQPLVVGQGTFTAASLAINSYGAYALKVTHSPAGGVGFVMSPTGPSSTMYVLNYVPAVSSVTPASVLQGSGPVTISIKGNHFLRNSPKGMTITMGSTTRDFTYVSPREIQLLLQPVDTAISGTLYASLTNYFSSSVPPYQSAVATINVAGATYNPGEETLPATIEVSPAGWRRRLPTLGNWNTVASTPGVYSLALREALKNSYPVGISTPAIPIANGIGATEVVEVGDGAYIGWDFAPGNQAKQIGLHTGVSRQQPFIIRAKKRPQGSTNEFESVLIGNNNTNTTVLADTGTTLYAAVSGPGGINRPSYMTFLGLRVMCSGQDGLNWGDASNANGAVDYLYRDIKWVKCAFLGRWDYRTISLTPRRHTRSITAANLSSQGQWNHLGNSITVPALGAGDSPLYTMNIQASEALACFSTSLPGYLTSQSPQSDNSMLVSAAVDQPVSLKGILSSIPASPRRPISDPTGTINRYVNPDFYTTDSINDYRVYVRLLAPSSGPISSCVWGGGVPSPNNNVYANVEQALGSTPEILSTSPYWTPVSVMPQGELLSDVGYLANSVANRPRSGRLYAGVWSYQNVRFKKPGRYAFAAFVRRNGSSIHSEPQHFFVNVTSTGVSQPDSRWEVMARNPVLPYLTGTGRSVSFTVPVLASLLEDTTPPTQHGVAGSIDQRIPVCGASSQNTPGVSGITDSFMVTISSPDYNARKWRWAYTNGTVYSPNIAGIGQYGFSANMVDGFIVPLIPTNPGSSVYGPLFLKCLSPVAGRQSVTLNIQVRPGLANTIRPGAYNFKSGPGLSVVVDLSPTATATTAPVAPLSFPITTGTRGGSSLKAFTVEGGTKIAHGGAANFSRRISSFDGRYFAPGWPGSPGHLNYDPEFRRWWPSPAKNLTYSEHGYSTKWGMQVYTHEGFDFLSSAVGYMYGEHNIYTHNCYGITIQGSLFKYAGRLNLQFTWRRWDNAPIPFDTTGGRSGWITGNNRFNYSSIGYDLIIKGNRFADSGLNDGTVHIGVTEHGGTTYIENNVHLNGFNSELRHVYTPGSGSSGTAFIVIYSGSAFKPTGNKEDMSFYFPYMTDAAGPVLNPADLNTYTRGLPVVSGAGLYAHFSPGHPAYYIFQLTRQMVLGGANDRNRISYRDGTTWSTGQTDINNATHPYRNRAYGHPAWSTAGKTDYIEVRPAWAQTDPNYPGGIVRLGAPQTNYPGAHQLGDVYLKNNIMWTNVYAANTVEETDASDTPGAHVRASWVTPGQIPIGLRQGSSFITGAVPGAGTRTGVFIGGARSVYMERNDIRHAPRPAVRISSVTQTSESSDPPALNVSGYGNNFLGGRDYFDHAPNQGGSLSQQMSFRMFRALLSPNPGPPGQLF